MKLGIFGSSRGGAAGRKGAAFDPKWARTRAGKFHRLVHLRTDSPELAAGGVYVVWHGGMRPAWVYAGSTENLGAALDAVLENERVTGYERNGGLFVSWSYLKPVSWDGVLAHFGQTTNFLEISPEMAKAQATPIPIPLPGA